MERRVPHNPLNGRFTTVGHAVRRSYDDAKPHEHSNYWSSTEYNTANAWNVNFGSVNVNNNNKYNTNNVVRPVAALDGLSHDFPLFYLTVIEAYHDCMRGKRSSPQALEYMKIAQEDFSGSHSSCTQGPTRRVRRPAF